MSQSSGAIPKGAIKKLKRGAAVTLDDPELIKYSTPIKEILEQVPELPPMIQEQIPDLPPMIQEQVPDIPPMVPEEIPDIPPVPKSPDLKERPKIRSPRLRPRSPDNLSPLASPDVSPRDSTRRESEIPLVESPPEIPASDETQVPIEDPIIEGPLIDDVLIPSEIESTQPLALTEPLILTEPSSKSSKLINGPKRMIAKWSKVEISNEDIIKHNKEIAAVKGDIFRTSALPKVKTVIQLDLGPKTRRRDEYKNDDFIGDDLPTENFPSQFKLLKDAFPTDSMGPIDIGASTQERIAKYFMVNF